MDLVHLRLLPLADPQSDHGRARPNSCLGGGATSREFCSALDWAACTSQRASRRRASSVSDDGEASFEFSIRCSQCSSILRAFRRRLSGEEVECCNISDPLRMWSPFARSLHREELSLELGLNHSQLLNRLLVD